MVVPLKFVSAVRKSVATCVTSDCSTAARPRSPDDWRHRMKNRMAAPRTTRNSAQDNACRAEVVSRGFIRGGGRVSRPRVQLGTVGQPHRTRLSGGPDAGTVDRVACVPLEHVAWRRARMVRAAGGLMR